MLVLVQGNKETFVFDVQGTEDARLARVAAYGQVWEGVSDPTKLEFPPSDETLSHHTKLVKAIPLQLGSAT
jgi:hypothetical protein